MVIMLFTWSCDPTPEETLTLSPTEEARYTTLLQNFAAEVNAFPNGKDLGLVRDSIFCVDRNRTETQCRGKINELIRELVRYNPVFSGKENWIDSIGMDQVRVISNVICMDPAFENAEPRNLEIDFIFSRDSVPRLLSITADQRDFRRMMWVQHEKLALEAGLFKDNGDPNFIRLEELRKTLTGDFESIVYAAKYKGKEFLYVGKDGFRHPNWDEKNFVPEGKVALANEQGKIISWDWYDDIGSFGMLADGLAEVRDGKYLGLIDETGDLFMDPVFNRLYPSYDSKYVAIGQVGSGFRGITPDKKIDILKEKPDLAKILKNFDFKSKLQPNLKGYPGEGVVPFTENGLRYEECVFTPFLFREMGIAPRTLPVRLYDAGEVEAIKVEKEVESPSGIKGLISMIETWTYGPREGFHGKAYQLSTYDSTLNTLQRVPLFTAGGEDMGPSYCDIAEIRMIGSDTLEAKYNYKKGYMEGQGTEYKYFVLRENGHIQVLDTALIYPFLTHAKIDGSYLRGCWVTEIPTEQWTKQQDYNHEGPWGEFWVTQHYSLTEVESMIRILRDRIASNGGTNPKERHNLDFLESYLPNLKNNEAKLVAKERKTIHGW